MEETQIKQLMAKDSAELYAELGRSILGRPAFPVPIKELIRAGKAWLKLRREEIKQIVCSDEVHQVVNGKEHKSELELAVLIANMIAVKLTAIPAGTLAVILVREGLTSFCGWQGMKR